MQLNLYVNSFVPYIYSKEELKLLFDNAMTYRKRFNILYPESVPLLHFEEKYLKNSGARIVLIYVKFDFSKYLIFCILWDYSNLPAEIISSCTKSSVCNSENFIYICANF